MGLRYVNFYPISNYVVTKRLVSIDLSLELLIPNGNKVNHDNVITKVFPAQKVILYLL